MTDRVYFWGPNKKNGEFSNFFESPMINREGTEFFCNEQYFMYYKCLLFDPDNTFILNKILTSTNPKEIKNFGRKVRNFNEKIWNENKLVIMKNGLELKFDQNPHLAKKLVATDDSILYEASPYDKIWGIGMNEYNARNTSDDQMPGQNLLGKLLMEIRDQMNN